MKLIVTFCIVLFFAVLAALLLGFGREPHQPSFNVTQSQVNANFVGSLLQHEMFVAQQDLKMFHALGGNVGDVTSTPISPEQYAAASAAATNIIVTAKAWHPIVTPKYKTVAMTFSKVLVYSVMASQEVSRKADNWRMTAFWDLCLAVTQLNKLTKQQQALGIS